MSNNGGVYYWGFVYKGLGVLINVRFFGGLLGVVVVCVCFCCLGVDCGSEEG